MARHKHRRESTPGGSQRQLRVGELVRHALAEMLTRGDVHDPVIEGHMITIPEVRMTADLRLATIVRWSYDPVPDRASARTPPTGSMPARPWTTRAV